MQVRLDLPDELSAALAASGADLSRAAFEAIALEAYRERKLTTAQLQRIVPTRKSIREPICRFPQMI
jgi:hypothetical protein